MFDNIRLPEEIEQGAKGGPAFQTSIITLSSGNEQRNADWSKSRQAWDIGYGMQDQADYNTCRDFFYARRAQANGFLFKDWSDFSMTGQILGIGDGTTKTFLLIKTYEASGPNPFVRRITRPVLSTLVVYVNGVAKTLTTDYITGDGGWIRFVSPPAAAAVVTVDVEFDVPVRFGVDTFPLVLSWVGAATIPSLPIIEVRDDFNASPSAVTFVNTVTTANETSTVPGTVTAGLVAHLRVADIHVADDPFGTNVLSLLGADAAAFELVGTINQDGDGVSLYLKAGTSLDFEKKASYAVTVNAVDPTTDGAAVSNNFTLTLVDINEPPAIHMTNTVFTEANGTSTAAPIRVADIIVLDDATATNGVVSLTLTGTDAASFHLTGTLAVTGTDPATGLKIYTGVSLYTNIGISNSSVSYNLNVNVGDASLASPPQSTVAFNLQFGVTPGTKTYVPGNTTADPIPHYSTLVIELTGPGAGGNGTNTLGNDGSADTTIVSLGLSAGKGKAALPSSMVGGLGGVAAGGDTNLNGSPGNTGVSYNAPTPYSDIGGITFNPTGFQFYTTAGGNNGAGLNGAISVAGPFYTFNSTPPAQVSVAGASATGVGGGGGGTVQYSQILQPGVSFSFLSYTGKAAGAPSGGGGAKVTKTYVYGVTAGAPNPGDVLALVVGAKGLGGVSFVNGGDGGDGSIKFTWS